MNDVPIARLWDESWGDGIWIAPWAKAVAGLTAQQAAWSPAPGRHSIWQIVHHVCVWREYTLTKVDGRPGPTREHVEALNFEPPAEVSERAWRDAVTRLERTHRDVRAAMDSGVSGAAAERLSYHLAHDCYHLGQIMYLRALQGLAPIE